MGASKRSCRSSSTEEVVGPEEKSKELVDLEWGEDREKLCIEGEMPGRFREKIDALGGLEENIDGPGALEDKSGEEGGVEDEVGRLVDKLESS